MAIIICKSCGKKTSDSSGRCMFCKAPVERKQAGAIKAPSIPDSMVSGAQNTAGMPQSGAYTQNAAGMPQSGAYTPEPKVSDSGIQNRTSGSAEKQKSSSSSPNSCDIVIYGFGTRKDEVIAELTGKFKLQEIDGTLSTAKLPVMIKNVALVYNAIRIVVCSKILRETPLDLRCGNDIAYTTRPGVETTGRFAKQPAGQSSGQTSSVNRSSTPISASGSMASKGMAIKYPKLCDVTIYDYGPNKMQAIKLMLKTLQADPETSDKFAEELAAITPPFVLQNVSLNEARFFTLIYQDLLMDVKDGDDIICSSRPNILPTGAYSRRILSAEETRQVMEKPAFLYIMDYGTEKEAIVAFLKKTFGGDPGIVSQAGQTPMMIGPKKYEAMLKLYTLLSTLGCKMTLKNESNYIVAANLGRYRIIFKDIKYKKSFISPLVGCMLVVSISILEEIKGKKLENNIMFTGFYKKDIPYICDEIKMYDISAAVLDEKNNIVFHNNI